MVIVSNGCAPVRSQEKFLKNPFLKNPPAPSSSVSESSQLRWKAPSSISQGDCNSSMCSVCILLLKSLPLTEPCICRIDHINTHRTLNMSADNWEIHTYLVIFLENFANSNSIHGHIVEKHSAFLNHYLLVIYETLSKTPYIALYS